jgi:fibronectin type 3 domain-containing protein
VSDISRGTGTDLTRDVNFTHDATFALDLAGGEYDVVAMIGDTSLAHDLVGVFLDGVERDTITTAGGQVLTRTYRVSVSDGQLNLRLADLGGSDWWAMICGLDVIFVGPDRTGPQVVSTNPSGSATGPVNHITLTFNEPIDASSFTLADVVLLEGPSGSITPAAVNHVGIGQVEVTFAPQNTSGTYRIVVGPNIRDSTSNLMDQDNDGIGGETPADRFETTFSLQAGPQYVARFDFGTATSPVAAGYTQITRNHRYSAATGHGWQSGSISDISRGTGTDLTRDVNFTHDGTFALDLANGEYDVIATIGDTVLAHDLVGLFFEGVQFDSITTAGGQIVARTYRVNVSDGQLNLRLADLGGSDWWAMIIALEVITMPGQVQSVSSIAVSELDASLRQYDSGPFERKSPAAPSSRAEAPLADVRGLELLHAIAARSQSRQPLRNNLTHAARDEALSSLFDVDEHRKATMELPSIIRPIRCHF